jgi:hypothetical protein
MLAVFMVWFGLVLMRKVLRSALARHFVDWQI